jgi:hypothetical protein
MFSDGNEVRGDVMWQEGQKVAGKRVSDGWSMASDDACCHQMSSTIIAPLRTLLQGRQGRPLYIPLED